MKFILCLVLAAVCLHSAYTQQACSTGSSNSANFGVYYSTTADGAGNQNCVPGVKHWCGGRAASTWKKGVKVLNNCASIPKHTAIATFDSSGNYYGHAAVFLSCSGTTIQVADQYAGKPWGTRAIWNVGSTLVNDPNNYYVAL